MQRRSVIFVEYQYYWGRGNWDRELMKRLARRGHSIHAVTSPFPEEFKHEEEELKQLGVKFRFVKTWNRFAFAVGALYETYRIVGNDRKAILYSPSIRLTPLYFPLKKLFNIPIVFSLQGAAIKEMETMPEFEDLRKHRLRYWLRRRIVACLETMSAKLADRVLVISQAIEEELVGQGIHPAKIELIYYCIDGHQFHRDQAKRQEVRQRFGIKENDTLIVYVARLSFDVPSRLQAAELLLEAAKNLDVKVLLSGGGSATDYVCRRIREKRLENKVFMTGFVPHKEIPAVLSASDVFFFVMKDPLPTYSLALLEAMSCGSIALTNDSGSAREIVKDGVNGYLVEPEVGQICAKLLDIMGQGRERLKGLTCRAVDDVRRRYSWDVAEERIERLLSELD